MSKCKRWTRFNTSAKHELENVYCSIEEIEKLSSKGDGVCWSLGITHEIA